MAASQQIVDRLLDSGLTREFVDAAMPDWWRPELEKSRAAKTMVALLLARRLSISPASLLSDDVPIGYIHTGPTKFKHMRLAEGPRREALIGYAQGVTRIALAALPDGVPFHPPGPAAKMRELLLRTGDGSSVGFGDVLTLCWSLGIPVLHLRLFPAPTKGVTAIAVRVGGRFAILVARDSGLSGQYMFHVAHELGHIALGHLEEASAIVDADPNDPANFPLELIDDEDEKAADAYAQELLTGSPSFSVLRQGEARAGSAAELARRARAIGQQLRIDPQHIALCFGYSTNEWPIAIAAAKLLPEQPEPPGTLVNRVLWTQLGPHDEEDRSFAFLHAVAPE